MVPKQSPSLRQRVPQVARHVAQAATHMKLQSQLPSAVQLRPKLTQRAPLAPPAPAPEGVKTHPLASMHDVSVNPLHVPSGVPMQFGVQKQPVIALQDWEESCVPQLSPTVAGVPEQDPRSMHPEVVLQSAPSSASHGRGVPEQVPGAELGPTA
jgi:hypothetical protein